MTISPEHSQPSCRAPFILSARLPGPDRKRSETPYCYRLIHRDLETAGPLCVFLWEVSGGRQEYQIALERETTGKLRWHCTCADAVYRGEDAPHTCKHVRGLQTLGRPTLERTTPNEPAA